MTNQTALFAGQVRLATLEELSELGFGHIGGCLSILETIAVLYGGAMHIDPANPQLFDRDRLVCSKGHAGPVIYAALALRGFFPRDWLLTLNQGGTSLPSHCDRNLTPGIDMTTGSLGQGISAAIGMAYGMKLAGLQRYTYLIIGDGECDEGQIWEGALLAPQLKLNNLIAFVDYNKQQLDDYTKNIIDLGSLSEKFQSFGWNTTDIDGHDTDAIQRAIDWAKQSADKPSMIVLHTIKGNGCGFAENICGNHHMNFTREMMEPEIKRAREKIKQMEEADSHEL